MKTILLAILILVGLAGQASAADWRIHLSKCGGNVTCAKNQATARETLKSSAYDRDLVRACEKTYKSSTYIKNHDYVGLLNCVDSKQISRNEKAATESWTRANNQLSRYLAEEQKRVERRARIERKRQLLGR